MMVRVPLFPPEGYKVEEVEDHPFLFPGAVRDPA